MRDQRTKFPAGAVALLLLGASLSLGCDGSPTGGATTPAVELTLGLSSSVGGTGAPIEVTAVAWNRTQMPVFYWDGCSFIDGMIFELFGSDGTQLDIKGLPMLCPDSGQTLDEGNQLVAKFTFQGTLYTWQGRAYEAASGTYTIRARFGWRTDLGSDAGFESTTETSFRWKSTSE